MQPICECPLPERLVLPLWQHAGPPAVACVGIGDKVVAGQCIGTPDGAASVAVHAPVAASVVAIEKRELPHPSRLTGLCVILSPMVDAHADAVLDDRNVTRRLICVGGSGVRQPGVFDVVLGTPIADLIKAAGGYTDRADRLILGGRMSGLSLAHDQFPILKASSSILVLSADECLRDEPALPCIRCGSCASACPADLLPQHLLRFGRNSQWGRAEENGLFDCIECGGCDLVCPSHIPLLAELRFAKSECRESRQVEQARDAARSRFEARRRRLATDATRRAEQGPMHRDGAALSAAQQALARARDRRGQGVAPPADEHKPT